MKVVIPPVEKEAEVFSDGAYDYGQRAADGPDLIQALLERLAELLFGGTDPADILRARNILIWTIVIAGTLIAILIFRRSAFSRLVQPASRKGRFDFRDIGGDISGTDFVKLAGEAAAKGDYRAAVRWHFLQILSELDRRKFIAFAPYKTNVEYGYELSGKPAAPLFSRLSSIYDHVWYGHFEVDEAVYDRSRLLFEQFRKLVYA